MLGDDYDCGSKMEQLECSANLNEPDREVSFHVSKHIKKSKD